jgi:hypothetical protein
MAETQAGRFTRARSVTSGCVPTNFSYIQMMAWSRRLGLAWESVPVSAGFRQREYSRELNQNDGEPREKQKFDDRSQINGFAIRSSSPWLAN